jgi:cytochrome c oxidase assembly protein subunit 11
MGEKVICFINHIILIVKLMKKFTIKFINEVDIELPWSFETLQEKLIVNAGETALAFYRAKNNTDEPIIGLSVYDVHPQTLAMYFNKIQCFCFENQMLGPREEVDLPVFFYIDPAINDDPNLEEYTEIILKYTFYMAKKQDLARVMTEHLRKEKEDQERLKEKKRELNQKFGKNYKIEDELNLSGLPGITPQKAEYILAEADLNSNKIL